MSRWAPDARERLRASALELFAAQGYGATTVPQIAAGAGLTTRTFFRYFSDKAEVFFGDTEIPDLATRMLAEAPADIPPLEFLQAALHRLVDVRFDPRRDEMMSARGIITAEAALRERDLRKRDELAAAIRVGLESRGQDELTASLIAVVVVDVLQTAIERWLGDQAGGSLHVHLDDAFARLRDVLA